MTDNINKPPENEALDLEKLDGVSGGYITNPTSGNKTEDYEVWDDSTGEVIGTFPSLEEAREAEKKAKKDGNCECNSASEMCSKTKSPKKPTSSTRASRACASRDSKSSHKSTTTKSCS